MRVNYRIILDVDTDDYVKTLGEIDDLLQDKLDGKPLVRGVRVILPRPIRGVDDE